MNVNKFEEKDYALLIEYNKIVFKKRDNIEESINYRLKNNPFNRNELTQTLIAKDGNENIIGQILIMPSEFTFQETVYPAFMGMDYYVSKEARSSLAGVILANKYKDLKFNFGIGLTDASLAVMNAFNVKVEGKMYKYLKFKSILSIFRFIFANRIKIRNNFIFPETINLSGGQFTRAYNPEEIISITGYWNRDLIEFTRSKEFISWRFFFYPNKYAVYKYINRSQGDNIIPVYFIVRPIVWKRVNCLLLVDYRFSIDNSEMFSKILEGVAKLSKRLGMAATITGCSLSCVKVRLRKKLFFKFGREKEIVTNFKNQHITNDKNSDSFLITFADSDSDFYYGNDKW